MLVQRMKITLVLVVLFGAALVLLTTARVAVASQPLDSDASDDVAALPLDHFWCYKTTSQPVNEVVGLQDQFHPQFEAVNVGAPKRFCNPVKKKHGDRVFGIVDPDAHLLFYEIGVAQQQTRLVEVRNQFGTKMLKVFEPAVLLAVPTKKNDHAAPQNLDHFQCYRVKGAVIDTFVSLKDQFTRAANRDVQKPVLLCNPARKIHNDQLTPVLHPKAHLVCYTITPKIFTRDADTQNQFRAEKITVIDPDLLCAPSKKRELQP